MISPIQYESKEEMEKCREKARIEIEKLFKELGFVVFEVADEINKNRRGKYKYER